MSLLSPSMENAKNVFIVASTREYGVLAFWFLGSVCGFSMRVELAKVS